MREVRWEGGQGGRPIERAAASAAVAETGSCTVAVAASGNGARLTGTRPPPVPPNYHGPLLALIRADPDQTLTRETDASGRAITHWTGPALGRAIVHRQGWASIGPGHLSLGRAISHRQFSSVQDGIYALGKAHICAPPPSLRSFPPMLPLKTVPMLVV